MLYGAFQKTVQTAIVLLIVSVASFGFLKLAPGDQQGQPHVLAQGMEQVEHSSPTT